MRSTQNSPIAIKRRLSILRRALGLTPSGMAKRLQISQQRWSNWESPSAKHQISKDGFNRLSQSTKITYRWIFFGDIGDVPYDLAEKIQRIEQMPAPAPKRKSSK